MEIDSGKEHIESGIPALPDDPEGILRALEDAHETHQSLLDQSAPGPLAPLAEQVKYAIEQARTLADGSVIVFLQQQQDELSK
jgi:hypothetical protein